MLGTIFKEILYIYTTYIYTYTLTIIQRLQYTDEDKYNEYIQMNEWSSLTLQLQLQVYRRNIMTTLIKNARLSNTVELR